MKKFDRFEFECFWGICRNISFLDGKTLTDAEVNMLALSFV